MSSFLVNGTGSFTLTLDERFVQIKTVFGCDRLSCCSRDLTIEQPFSQAYGKMSVCQLVPPFSFSFIS